MFRKLQEIREADKATRVRWVIILSTISTILVIIVWKMSLNVITADIAAPPDLKPAGSFTSKLGAIWDEVALRTGNTIDHFKSSISSKEIELQQIQEDQQITPQQPQ